MKHWFFAHIEDPSKVYEVVSPRYYDARAQVEAETSIEQGKLQVLFSAEKVVRVGEKDGS